MNLSGILQLLHEVEQLKKELRHSWLSDGRQESVAEHTWRMSLMAMLLQEHLTQPIDILKVMKMITIHDINEAYVWDTPAFLAHHAEQKEQESKNMKDMWKRFPWATMQEIISLRNEFEEQNTDESKFVKALDKIEVRIQHNEAQIDTRSDIEFPRALFSADIYVKFDEQIQQFNELIKQESRIKIIKESNKDIYEIDKQVIEMQKK
jgi:putative hydrolases of HD superfamily